MKYLKRIGLGLVLIGLIYAIGPKPNKSNIDNTPITLSYSLEEIDHIITVQESEIEYLKLDNQAHIKWADSTHKKTKYSLVYLHGFSASHEEGAPIHEQIAKRYGMNFYLSRLAGHGTNEPEPFENLTVSDMIESAKTAIAIGKLLGDKVIVMSCSTGGTFSLYLAANDPAIACQILYSPNIDLYDKSSEILTAPWGLQIARLISGGKKRSFESNYEIEKYWTTTYRLEGVVTLKLLLELTMTNEVFKKVKQPTFIGYYYKNEEEQDKVISVKRILEMSDRLGTNEKFKTVVAFPDVAVHALNSRHRSQDLESVRNETITFLEEVMGLEPETK